MKWLITGLGGTLAPVLAREAASQDVEVIGWKRDEVPPEDIVASEAWLQAVRPDAIAHLGMGSAEWAGRLAGYAAGQGLPFVFTSTAMVFHHEPDGPHAPGDARNAQDGYGQYKRTCEDAVLAAHPGASVVRIGWQIDPRQPGNNMLMALDQWQDTQGRVAGVLHLDSNAQEGHSFLEIVHALKQAFGRDHWDIQAHEDYVHDQRLVGSPARVPALSGRLELPAARSATL